MKITAIGTITITDSEIHVADFNFESDSEDASGPQLRNAMLTALDYIEKRVKEERRNVESSSLIPEA